MHRLKELFIVSKYRKPKLYKIDSKCRLISNIVEYMFASFLAIKYTSILVRRQKNFTQYFFCFT